MADDRISKLTRSPGVRVLAMVTAALAWGLTCGYLRAPYWCVIAGALAASTVGLWLIRDVLMASARGARRTVYWRLAAAYGFVTMVAIGLVSLAALLGTWLLHR